MPLSKLNTHSINGDDSILGLDLLYGLVENDTIDINRLRYLSLRYQENEETDLALRLNRFIASIDTDNISSIRALADSYLKKKGKIQALNVYTSFLDSKQNLNEKNYNIMYNDMLHIYNDLSYDEKQNVNLKMTNNNENLRQTRIVFEWSVPNELLFIELVDAKNKSLKMQLGDGFDDSNKAEEFFIHNSGENLKLNLSLAEKKELEGFLKMTIYKNWLSNKNTPEIKVFDLSSIEKLNYELLDLAYNY
jgi:hypothetical protein